MPITSPSALNNGPPELPRFIAASVWTYGTKGGAARRIVRSTALMIPKETLKSNPIGDPMMIA